MSRVGFQMSISAVIAIVILLAKDGGKTEITYNTIESRYAGSDVNEGTPRTVWADYQHPTDGGLDQRTYTLNNHFFLNGEYPYCSGNDAFGTLRNTDVLSNIICEGDGGFGEIS